MLLFTGQKLRLCRNVAAGLMVLATSGMLSAQPDTTNDHAILIVGDETSVDLRPREKLLIQEIAKNMRKNQRMPIYSYHFNNERERSYCEKKLGILREDLLFIGIVSLKDKIPRKVVYRLDRIVTPARAAQDIVARADELNDEPAGTQAVDPSPSPSPSASATPQAAGKFRVQLGAFGDQKGAQSLVEQLRGKGYEARFDKVSSEGKEVFKVWVGSFPSKEDAQQATTELQADGFEKGFVVEK